MKKIFFCFFIFFLYSKVIYGQEELSPPPVDKKNAISGGVNISRVFSFPVVPGLHLEYERLLGDKFSAGLEIGINWVTIPYIKIQGRLYPRKKMFFTGLGWGFWGLPLWKQVSVLNYQMTTLEFGWKINIGKKRNWFFTPSAVVKLLYIEYPAFINPQLNLSFGYKF